MRTIPANMSAIDRFLRIILGELAILYGYFWVSGVAELLCYVVGSVMFLTAVIGYCPLYGLFRISSIARRKGAEHADVREAVLFSLLAVTVLGAGVYGSITATTGILENDIRRFYAPYVRAVVATGRNDRQVAVAEYMRMSEAFLTFRTRYAIYRPYVLKNDTSLKTDLDDLDRIMLAAHTVVTSGNLSQAHDMFILAQGVMNGFFRRNHIMPRAKAVIELNGMVERMVSASGRMDVPAVISIYPEAELVLRQAERVITNDEIKLVRADMTALFRAAKGGMLLDIARHGEILKADFVKLMVSAD